MSGSMEWQLRPGNSFEKRLKLFFEKNYKNDKTGKQKFIDEFNTLQSDLRQNPMIPNSFKEKWPANSYNPKFDLIKYYFKLPNLSGSAREGRLIYLLDKEQKTIVLLTIYTHKQEKDRPDDSELRNLINNKNTF